MLQMEEKVQNEIKISTEDKTELVKTVSKWAEEAKDKRLMNQRRIEDKKAQKISLVESSNLVSK